MAPPPSPPEPAPAQAPTLPADLLEEIFLRLPPDEPEWLVRASLASKLWLGRLAAPRFRGRYREFHGGAPPMLGFFYSIPGISKSEEPPLVSTTKFRARVPDPGKRWYSSLYEPWDCRHGRVLLGGNHASPKKLVVWDPITGRRRELDAPGFYNCFGAAVLCAVNGCDHHACHGGPSRVVFVGLGMDNAGFAVYAYESLPETGERSKPHSHLRQWKPCARLQVGPDASIQLEPTVLIQDALYFKLVYDEDEHVGILKYDLCSKCLSVIDAPLPVEDVAYTTILMGMEDGSLGFALLDGFTLSLWSRKMGSDGVWSWTECRVIDLKELLPVPNKRLRPIGSVEGGDAIFVTTKFGIYKINLKSLECRRIWKKEEFRTLVPYMSFYYPQERAKPCDAVH